MPGLTTSWATFHQRLTLRHADMAHPLESKLHFGTLAIHAGQEPDPSTGSIMTPIHQTSTYVQSSPGEHLGYEYARVSNPTRTALEGNLAALEGARHGICFASGVAGIDAIMKGLDPGDKVVASDDLYGGTFRLFNQVFARYGLKFEYVDMTRLDEVEAVLAVDDVRLVWLETPSNPMMRIIDLEAVADMARSRKIETAVDNTFATPYLQQPLSMGIDLVLHSTTKYLGGHSDVIGGVVCTNSDEWAEKLRFQVKSSGAVPGPMDCFLTLRGTKTLHVRMQRHCDNAGQMADYLSRHPKVSKVYFPGLPSHPGHELARRQMNDFGGMISFTLRSGEVADVKRVLSATRVFSLAESLGGVESLVEHPSTMTHASMTAEQRERAGISDGLIRLSVGIEDYVDLEEDLGQALDKAL